MQLHGFSSSYADFSFLWGPLFCGAPGFLRGCKGKAGRKGFRSALYPLIASMRPDSDPRNHFSWGKQGISCHECNPFFYPRLWEYLDFFFVSSGVPTTGCQNSRRPEEVQCRGLSKATSIRHIAFISSSSF